MAKYTLLEAYTGWIKLINREKVTPTGTDQNEIFFTFFWKKTSGLLIGSFWNWKKAHAMVTRNGDTHRKIQRMFLSVISATCTTLLRKTNPENFSSVGEILLKINITRFWEKRALKSHFNITSGHVTMQFSVTPLSHTSRASSTKVRKTKMELVFAVFAFLLYFLNTTTAAVDITLENDDLIRSPFSEHAESDVHSYTVFTKEELSKYNGDDVSAPSLRRCSMFKMALIALFFLVLLTYFAQLLSKQVLISCVTVCVWSYFVSARSSRLRCHQGCCVRCFRIQK